MQSYEYSDSITFWNNEQLQFICEIYQSSLISWIWAFIKSFTFWFDYKLEAEYSGV